MERNPYRAPTAAVRDLESAAAPPPRQVRLACWMFWVLLAVDMASLHPAIRGEWWSIGELEVEEDDPEELVTAFTAVVVFSTVVFSLIYAALVVLIARRHNWARWAMLGFVVFGAIVVGFELDQSLAETPTAAAIDLLTLPAEAFALYLLFFGPGAAWFRAMAT